MEMGDTCFLKQGGVAPFSSPRLAISVHCMGCQMSDSLHIVAYTF